MIITKVWLRWVLITLALIQFLALPLAVAQQGQPDAAPAEVAQDQDVDEQTIDERAIDERAIDEQPIDVDEQAGEDRPAQSDRFIPSEQISQDLGVSYPVDI